MMLPIKKEFVPSLPPISQVIQLQNFTILKPTIREGSIRKQKTFISSWKHKVLCFLFVPDEKLICEVFNHNGVKVQETINLATAKLSKRCSEVDDKICFGIVTPNDQKYLLALKSNRECLKIFNQIASAKKILGMSMFKSYRNEESTKDGPHTYKYEEIYKDTKSSCKENSSQNSKLDEIQKSEEVILSPHSEPQSIGSSHLKFNPKQSEFSKNNTLFQNTNKNNLIQQCMSLQQLKGYKLIKELPNGNLYQNESKMTKGTMLIYSPQSAREIFSLFYQLDVWNSKVRKFKKVSRVSNGVYRFYVQFHKNGCLSSKKCCEVVLCLSKWENDFYLTMNTTTQKSQYIEQSNWISFISCAKIKSKVNNPRQKQIYICLSSQKHSQFIIQFAKQIKNLPSFIHHQTPTNHQQLQIRNL